MNKEQIEDADCLSPKQFKEESGARGYQNNFAMHKSNATYWTIMYIQPTINAIVGQS